jgi:phosphomannomutase
MSVFKAYDVRGIYPAEINEDLAYRVGKALVLFLSAKNLVVGYDMRLSSKPLLKKLVEGIIDQGCNVTIIGLCTTPLLNYSVAAHKFDGGIMISASHNPSEYNAFKLIKHPVLQIGEDTGMKTIEKLAGNDTAATYLNSRITKADNKKIRKGRITKKSYINEYYAHIMRFTKNISKLKVVVDYGNGVGSVTAKPIFKKLPLKIISMFEKPDGTFPNHLANPHDVQNILPLQKRVKKEKADIGIFFDGDADRSIIVDNNGEIIFPDFVLALLAQQELLLHPNEKIYYDLRFSKIVKEIIERHKGIAIMEKVGNPIYKEKLATEGGILGGEFSGHIMFRDNYNIDDGLFSVIKLMSLISIKKKPLTELIKPLQKYCQLPEINIKTDNPKKAIDILDKYYSHAKKYKLDGLTVEEKNYWFNVRPSNTEPLIRIRIEANDPITLEQVRKKIIDIIK